MPSPLRNAIYTLHEAINTPTDKLEKLNALVTSMVDDPSLNNLTARELRAFQGFRQTLNACKNMTDESIKKHIYAHWEGGDVKQAMTKLPIYKAVKKVYDDLMGKPVFNTNPVEPFVSPLRDEVPAYLDKNRKKTSK